MSDKNGSEIPLDAGTKNGYAQLVRIRRSQLDDEAKTQLTMATKGAIAMYGKVLEIERDLEKAKNTLGVLVTNLNCEEWKDYATLTDEMIQKEDQATLRKWIKDRVWTEGHKPLV